jgi:hypothetical protein
MSERGKELFNRLKRAKAILALIGESEDSHLDCKEWPPDDKDAQRVLAKAACGLANAEGGVILVGMKARPKSKGDPDLIQSAAPVADASAVKSRILNLLGEIVEPGIEGIQAAKVNEKLGSKSGFVVVYVPAAEGPPRRSKKDWKFYVRIASGTYPMEYFQIEERFGKRPPPRLELYLEPDGIRAATFAPRTPARWFVLGLQNLGSGIAKFPNVRYRRASGLIVSHFGIDGNMGFGLPQRPSDNEWVIFGGGVDEVIYPGETRKITRLAQDGRDTGIDPRPKPALGPFGASGQTLWSFSATNFQCEISCEGAPTKTVDKAIPEDSSVWP